MYVTASPDRRNGTERDYYIAVVDLKTCEVTSRIQTNVYGNGLALAALK